MLIVNKNSPEVKNKTFISSITLTVRAYFSADIAKPFSKARGPVWWHASHSPKGGPVWGSRVFESHVPYNPRPN